MEDVILDGEIADTGSDYDDFDDYDDEDIDYGDEESDDDYEDAEDAEEGGSESGEAEDLKPEDDTKYSKTEVEQLLAKERAKAQSEKYLNKPNPYTDETMATPSDIEEFMLMKELDERGEDPLLGIRKYYKNQIQTNSELKQAVDGYSSTINRCKEKYGIDADVEQMYEKDSEFKTFVDDKITAGTRIEDAIGWYFDIKQTNGKAERRAKDITAKQLATPGSLSGARGEAVDVESMSDDEFDRYLTRIKK